MTKLVAVWMASLLCACTASHSGPIKAPMRRSADVAEPQITGVVVDEDGSPLSCVVVNARYKESGDPVQVLADERGRFAFDGLANGWWFFTADDLGHAKPWWRENAARIPRRVEDTPLTVQLHRPRSVDAIVVDESGSPVPGVTIRLGQEWIKGQKYPVQGHLSDEVGSSRSGSDGHVSLRGLRPGTISVVMDHPNFSRTVARLQVPSSDGRLTILRGLALEGEVVQDGRALAGVRVRAAGTALSQLSMGSFTTTTDQDGRFHLDRIHEFSDEHGPLRGVPTITLSIDDPERESDLYRVFEDRQGKLPFVRMQCRARHRGALEPVVVEVRGENPVE